MEWAEGTGGSFGAVKACLGGTSRGGGSSTDRPNRSFRVRFDAHDISGGFMVHTCMPVSKASVALHGEHCLSVITRPLIPEGADASGIDRIRMLWCVPHGLRRRRVQSRG